MSEVTVKIDATKAVAKLGAITPHTRDRLRSVIPSLTKAVARQVNANLDGGLKSRTHVLVKTEMRESTRYIIGQVSAVWTGDPAANMVPRILESGARAHVIEAKNANALHFFWEKLGGKEMFLKSVQHPGFAGIYYMQRAFDAMKDEIAADIREAARAGAREAV